MRVLGVRSARSRGPRRRATGCGSRSTYDDTYKVPADAKAVVVAAVGGQRPLRPAHPVYTAGPVLADGAASRSSAPPCRSSWTGSSPASTTSTSRSGPRAPTGRRAVPAAGGRRGQPRRRGRQDQPDGRRPLAGADDAADGDDDLFGTVAQPAGVHHRAGRQRRARCGAFNTDLASVADQLAGERDDLALALKNLAVALGEVASFVKENKANLTTDVKGLADITGMLAKQKDALAEVLEAGPAALSNLQTSPTTRLVRHARHPRQRRAGQDPGGLPLLAADVRSGSRRASATRSTRCSRISQFPKPGCRASPSGQSARPRPHARRHPGEWSQ